MGIELSQDLGTLANNISLSKANNKGIPIVMDDGFTTGFPLELPTVMLMNDGDTTGLGYGGVSSVSVTDPAFWNFANTAYNNKEDGLYAIELDKSNRKIIDHLS